MSRGTCTRRALCLFQTRRCLSYRHRAATYPDALTWHPVGGASGSPDPPTSRDIVPIEVAQIPACAGARLTEKGQRPFRRPTSALILGAEGKESPSGKKESRRRTMNSEIKNPTVSGSRALLSGAMGGPLRLSQSFVGETATNNHTTSVAIFALKYFIVKCDMRSTAGDRSHFKL